MLLFTAAAAALVLQAAAEEASKAAAAAVAADEGLLIHMLPYLLLGLTIVVGTQLFRYAHLPLRQ